MPKGIFQKDVGTVIEKSDMEKGIIEGILTKGKVLDSPLIILRQKIIQKQPFYYISTKKTAN